MSSGIQVGSSTLGDGLTIKFLALRGLIFASSTFAWAAIVDAQICWDTQDKHCAVDYGYEIYCNAILCANNSCPGGAEASSFRQQTYRVGYSTHSGFWGTTIGQSSVKCRMEVACENSCFTQGSDNLCNGPTNAFEIASNPNHAETYEVNNEIGVGYGCPYF